MSAKQKETANIAGDWLYKGLAIYFLWNIYMDVKQIPVHEERLNRHELRLNNIEQNLFAPAWNKDKQKQQTSEEHTHETNELIETTETKLAEVHTQNSVVDSFLNLTNSN